MNTATQNLENDHVYILQLTEVMQKMASNGATNINHFKSVVNIIEDYEGGNEAALQYIHHNMLGYAELLQNHIYKENNILFRMADDALTEDDQNLLVNKFNKIESAAQEGNKIEDFISGIEELAKHYSE